MVSVVVKSITTMTDTGRAKHGRLTAALCFSLHQYTCFLFLLCLPHGVDEGRCHSELLMRLFLWHVGDAVADSGQTVAVVQVLVLQQWLMVGMLADHANVDQFMTVTTTLCPQTLCSCIKV